MTDGLIDRASASLVPNVSLGILDLRPKTGIIKVRNFSGLETQVDTSTGEILKTAQRRNDFVVKMHDLRKYLG